MIDLMKAIEKLSDSELGALVREALKDDFRAVLAHMATNATKQNRTDDTPKWWRQLHSEGACLVRITASLPKVGNATNASYEAFQEVRRQAYRAAGIIGQEIVAESTILDDLGAKLRLDESSLDWYLLVEGRARRYESLPVRVHVTRQKPTPEAETIAVCFRQDPMVESVQTVELNLGQADDISITILAGRWDKLAKDEIGKGVAYALNDETVEAWENALTLRGIEWQE